MKLDITNTYIYIHRTLCDVLEEMRKSYESRNFAPLMGLIEEAQSMANRMEAGLAKHKDLGKLEAEYTALKKAVRKLQAKHKKKTK